MAANGIRTHASTMLDCSIGNRTEVRALSLACQGKADVTHTSRLYEKSNYSKFLNKFEHIF